MIISCFEKRIIIIQSILNLIYNNNILKRSFIKYNNLLHCAQIQHDKYST